MKKICNKSNVILCVTAITILLVSMVGQADAGTATYNYTIEFSGATPPTGPTPWLTAIFDDSFGGANNVRLTMSATNLQNVEYVDDWYFNFDSALDASLLSFSFAGGSAGAANSAAGSNNGFKADGDGWYDIKFDYPPPPGSFNSLFTTGETAVYDITYTSAIDVSSFNFFSAPGGGQGTYLAAAHVQGIDPAGAESGWVAVVPEPISSTLFIIGGATLGFRRLRK